MDASSIHGEDDITEEDIKDHDEDSEKQVDIQNVEGLSKKKTDRVEEKVVSDMDVIGTNEETVIRANEMDVRESPSENETIKVDENSG